MNLVIAKNRSTKPRGIGFQEVVLAVGFDGLWRIFHRAPRMPIARAVKAVRSSAPRNHLEPSAAIDFEAVEALRGLGFTKSLAVALLLASASSDLTSTESRVMAALKAQATASPQAMRRMS